MDIIRTESISKVYSGHCALNKVSVQIPEKSIFGLLGPNGAGKTSLIRILTQILKADEGKVFFKNEILSSDHSRMTGYLPEERGLYRKMKTAEQLVYLARLRGLSYNEATHRVNQWLTKMDLITWKDKTLESLSKGMQQKVQFIAAVIHDPALLILDEPFTGFDPINSQLLKKEILTLRENGTTIVLSSHRMDSVEELCDHVALIHRSQKILEGPLKEIKNKFKEHIYQVECESEFQDVENFLVVESSREGNSVKLRLKCKKQWNENQILSRLISIASVKSFKEEIPTMESIFMNQVKEEGR